MRKVIRMKYITITLILFSTLVSCSQEKNKPAYEYKYSLSEEEWKNKLSPEQYRVLREKGTEPAWTGKYNDFHEKGIFICAGCGDTLFTSQHKFDSHCGWPSFYTSYDNDKIQTQMDSSYGMIRVEIMCNNCGGHLGHVFDDGPRPTRQRYCVNSASLDFIKLK